MKINEVAEVIETTAKYTPSIPKFVNDFIEFSIGNWMDYRNTLSKIKYKTKLQEKLNAIPKEKIIEPKLSILGPALEASRYYIEEEEIQELFANLIAASMNSDYEEKIPHSFVEIIKQLSSHDAKIFQSFSDPTYPCAAIRLVQKETNLGFYLYRTFFINESFPDCEKNSISLVNLQKQGLIVIDEKYALSDYMYAPFRESNFYKSYIINSPLFSKYKDYNVTLSKGAFHITNLGYLFKDICIK